MKTKTIIFVLLAFFAFTNVNSQTVLQKILETIIKEGAKALEKKPSLKNLVAQTLVVNSSSNARFSGGKTREAIKINLPQGTTTWYYRVTVLPVTSTYEYQDNETFNYLLSNNKHMETYTPTDEGIDFYILGHSGDVTSFLETGNNNFKAFQEYTKTGTNSFVGSCNINQENLWIGIKNPNTMTGLKVIVEVVAWGVFE